MRVNLLIEPFSPQKSAKGKIPLSLTIKPASGFPGEYQMPTDNVTLMQLLRQKTDLPAPALERFEAKMTTKVSAPLLVEEISDGVLTEIGDFIH